MEIIKYKENGNSFNPNRYIQYIFLSEIITVLYGNKYAFDDEVIQLIQKYVEIWRKEVIYGIIKSYVPLISLFMKQNEETKYVNEKAENLTKSMAMGRLRNFNNESHNCILDTFLSAHIENERNPNAEHFKIENINKILKALILG